MNTAQNYRAGNSHANATGLTAQNNPSTGQTNPLPAPSFSHQAGQLTFSLALQDGQSKGSQAETLYWLLDNAKTEALNELVLGNHNEEQIELLHDKINAYNDIQNELVSALFDQVQTLLNAEEVSRG